MRYEKTGLSWRTIRGGMKEMLDEEVIVVMVEMV